MKSVLYGLSQKDFSVKTKVLRSLVKGAKGQGNKFENAATNALLGTRKAINSAKWIGTPVKPVGETVTKGVSKVASEVVKHPHVTATGVISKSAIPVLGSVNPALGAAYAASPVGIATVLLPKTIQADRKLLAKHPGLRRVADGVGNFHNTGTGKDVSGAVEGVYRTIQRL